MLRAFFLAVGLYSLILGLECLVLEKAVLKPRQSSGVNLNMPQQREINPPEQAPWLLLSAGSVVMLYSFTLPAKMRG